MSSPLSRVRTGLRPVVVLVRRLRQRDSGFVRRHLDGLKGIEIGGSAHNRFRIDAINVDRYPGADTPYKRAERRAGFRPLRVDLVAPGDDLPFKDDAVDFVFSSHVIEHFPDPIRALTEWVRVARTRVVLIAPHRDRTFDRDRPVTPVAELLDRHRDGFTTDDDRHWSVWTLESFVELCDAIGLRVVETLDPDDKVGNGFAVVIDATQPPRIPSGTPDAAVSAPAPPR